MGVKNVKLTSYENFCHERFYKISVYYVMNFVVVEVFHWITDDRKISDTGDKEY